MTTMAAVKYALARLRLQPFAIEAWKTVTKSAAVSLISLTSDDRKRAGVLTHE